MNRNINNSFLLDFYGGLLSEKQQRLFSLYYEDDLSLSEIAELENMTRQGVHDAIKRAEHQLNEMEEQLSLAKRFLKVQQSIERIKAGVTEISTMTSLDDVRNETAKLLVMIDELQQAEE